MMHPHQFFTGENRRLSFFENTNEAMPSQEAPDTKQEKRVNAPDKTPEKNDEQTNEAMEKMMQRIEQGEQSRKNEMKTLQSTEKLQKKFDVRNSEANDVDDVIAVVSKDTGDIAEESADLGMTAGLNDISDDIGRKPTPNEAPDAPRAEVKEEAAPAEKETAEEATKSEQKNAAQNNAQANAPSENPEGRKPR